MYWSFSRSESRFEMSICTQYSVSYVVIHFDFRSCYICPLLFTWTNYPCVNLLGVQHILEKKFKKIILPQQNSFEINSLQIQEIEIHLSEIKVRFKLCLYQRNVLTGPSNWVLSLWKHRWSRLGICLLWENYSAPVELICLMLFILIQFIYICSLFCYCLSSVALLSLSLYS